MYSEFRGVERCSESRVINFVLLHGKCMDGNQILFLLLNESHEMDLEPYVIKGEHDCRARIQLDSGKVQKNVLTSMR